MQGAQQIYQQFEQVFYQGKSYKNESQGDRFDIWTSDYIGQVLASSPDAVC